MVPAGDKMAAGAALMPRAHLVGPGGGVLAVGNHLFAVASTKTATTRTWHDHGTREGPWFLSRVRRDHYINLHE